MSNREVEGEIKLAETVKTVLDEGVRVTKTMNENAASGVAGSADAKKSAALKDLQEIFEGGSGFFGNALQAIKGNTLAQTASLGMGGGGMFSSPSSSSASSSDDKATSSSNADKSAKVSTTTAKGG
jgi:hypothetical protein